jgi:stage II sporulation protein D
MRRTLCLIFCVLAAPASASAGTAFFVDGHGWGHGIGMAQWGAYGYALKEDRSYDWILAHYYKDTTLSNTAVRTVRVQLATGRQQVRIGSAEPFTFRDKNDKTVVIPGGAVTVTTALKVDGKKLVEPVTVTRGARNLSFDGRLYRGKFVLHLVGGRLMLVNQVGINDYIKGVVPDEMPPSWSMEALKAQAVAARSYAVATRKSGGLFDLYPDTRSQVYGGVSAEEVRSSNAVDATAKQVVKYNGNVATTFFFSTSGGKTASIQDVWNSDPVPYLVSVRDKYDYLSPHHSWGTFRYTASQLNRALGSAGRGRLVDATVARNASLRVDRVTLRGTGGTSSVSGTGFQGALGLRSSWFGLAVLRLTANGTVKAGKAYTLNALVRGVKDVWLERRVGSGAWQKVRDLDPGADGAFAIKVRPGKTTSFRLAAPKGKGVPVRVTVVQ